MASSINASTAGAGGVITTADASGILNLQSGGVTVATVQSTGFSTPTNSTISVANTFGFKNRIINGGMTISQYNGSSSVTPSPGNYVVDRWYWQASQTPKVTIQQNQGSVTPPVGFSNYLGVTSSSAYSITSTDYFWISQKIEGFNVADLGWGTANAKTVTVSFQVYSSLTGTFGGCVQNPAQTRSYPISYSIPTANTWTSISITIPGDTSGTWVGATNAAAINLVFSLGMGSAYSGTANAWASAAYESSTGAVSVVGTNGATFYITGVQLEVGSQATSFDFRDYGTELVRCQRYYETGGGVVLASNAYYNYYYKVTKRTSPTVTNVVAAGGSVSVGSSTGTGEWYQNSNATSLSTMTFTASAEL